MPQSEWARLRALERRAREIHKNWVKHLKFSIFGPGVYLRLDRDGKVLPCSKCGVVYRENLFETFDRYCLNVLAVDRATLGEPAVETLYDCARCRGKLGDDDGDARFCRGCLLEMLREFHRVQPSFAFNPKPAPTARVKRPQSAVGGAKVSACSSRSAQKCQSDRRTIQLLPARALVSVPKRLPHAETRIRSRCIPSRVFCTRRARERLL
jgi:hypothetical protein